MQKVKMYDRIKWRLVMHIGDENMHSLLFRGRFMGRGIQKEVYTPANRFGEFRKAETYYFIDGDEREFTTEEELIEVIRQNSK